MSQADRDSDGHGGPVRRSTAPGWSQMLGSPPRRGSVLADPIVGLLIATLASIEALRTWKASGRPWHAAARHRAAERLHQLRPMAGQGHRRSLEGGDDFQAHLATIRGTLKRFEPPLLEHVAEDEGVGKFPADCRERHPRVPRQLVRWLIGRSPRS